jgi:hypothetical protein
MTRPRVVASIACARAAELIPNRCALSWSTLKRTALIGSFQSNPIFRVQGFDATILATA